MAGVLCAVSNWRFGVKAGECLGEKNIPSANCWFLRFHG